MLRFQWDSLRRGDYLLAHDVRTADLRLRPAVVELVDLTGPRRDIVVRYLDGPDAGRLDRPGRFAIHPNPLADTVLMAAWRWPEAAAA